MILRKSYRIFWVQTQPCTPELLEKNVLPLTTQCVCVCIDNTYDLIVIACDCVVRNCMCVSCNDAKGPWKSSLWLSGSPRKIRYQKKCYVRMHGTSTHNLS